MTLDFEKMSIEDLRLLRNKIDNQLHLRAEAERRTKINNFKNALEDLIRADIRAYVSVPNDWDYEEDGSFPLDWCDLDFN